MAESKGVQDLVTLRKDLDNLGTGIKSLLDKQEEDIRRLGATHDSTGRQLDTANEKWEQIAEDVKGVNESMQAKISEFEKKMSRAAMGGFNGNVARKLASLGQVLVTSDQFKRARENGEFRSAKVPFSTKSVTGLERKDVNLTSAELGALVQEFRWDQVVNLPVRPRRIMDLIPSIPVTSNAIEYPRESVKYELYAELASQAASGQKDVVLDGTAEGFYPGQTVTLSTGLAQEEDIVIDSVDYDTLTLTAVDNLTNTHAAGRSAVSETFVYTPEAKIKPKSRVEFDLETATIKTLATIMPVSKQMLSDAPSLQAYIDARMREFLELNKERELLYGDNSTRQIQGIMTDADIHTYDWSSGTVGDLQLDAIRRAATLAMLSFLPPDGVVVHPNDWEDIELSKATDGHYVFSQIQVSSGVSVVWRLQVIETPVIEETHALVGGFNLGAMIWDRQMAEMSLSDQNREWWEKNVVGIRLEERMAQSVIRPQAFVDVHFDSAPAAP
jgi:HK97 family phage major capsid protein